MTIEQAAWTYFNTGQMPSFVKGSVLKNAVKREVARLEASGKVAR